MIETATGTFLLTWNPRKTPWRDYEEWENGKSTRKPPLDSWSTGNRKTIPVGSRVFLVRQHDHRGIIASGHTRVPVYQDAHWNASDHDANYVDVRLEVLLPLRARLTVEYLKRRVAGVKWDDLYASGESVVARSAIALQLVWDAHLTELREHIPAPRAAAKFHAAARREVDFRCRFYEGNTREVRYDRHERNKGARLVCLKYHGLACVVCGETMEQRYGPVAAGIIHVHHVLHLFNAHGRQRVDPKRDLKPVCPNCHAVLHACGLTIREMRRILSSRKSKL